MRGTRGIKPLIAVNFMVADHAAHALIEYLRATAGQRIQAGVLELTQGFFN